MTKQPVFIANLAESQNCQLDGGKCVKQEEQEMIRTLRLQGWGYKRIAKELKLNRNQVQLFCKIHGLGGAGEFVKLNMPIWHRPK